MGPDWLVLWVWRSGSISSSSLPPHSFHLLTRPSLFIIGALKGHQSVDCVHITVCCWWIAITSRFRPLSQRLTLSIMSWIVLRGAILKVIIFRSLQLLSFGNISIKTLSVVPASSFSDASLYQSFLSSFSRLLYTWIVMYLSLLRAFLITSYLGHFFAVVAPAWRMWDFGEAGHYEGFEGLCFRDLLGYVAYWRSRDVEWSQCTSLRFTYNYSMGELSDVPSRIAPTTWRCNVDEELTGDFILSGFPVHFVPGDLILLRFQTYGGFWLSEYHQCDVPGL